MATAIFSCFWILLTSTGSSSNSVAESLLSLAYPGVQSSDIQDGQIKLTSVAVQTVACLLIFLARRLCFVFNTTIAVFKVLLLVIIFISGMAFIRGKTSELDDFNLEYPGYNGADALTAMMYIIFCYQGWDNANYVRYFQVMPWLHAVGTDRKRSQERLKTTKGLLDGLVLLRFYF